uniref:Alpha-2-HS-glycoprotein-like n=1 Tax=Hippocampus comes TaxID=109280 RepID=A0A3Q2XQL5_HIPCM
MAAHLFAVALWCAASAAPFGGCRVDASLKLVQTKCHVTNPKPHQECVPFRLDERGAVATCSVSLDVVSGVATVRKHRCATRPEHTNAEMAWICPDCPMLSPLDDPMGVKAAHQAVLKFNRESKHRNYFTLMEVSQITGGYIMTIGMLTWLKLALVETDCPRHAENTFAPCAPRCSDQASHVFCQATYYNWQDQIGELGCEFYPPRNSASRSPGMPKPKCRPLFHESREGFACKAQLGIRQPVIHHICPFPLIVQQPQWVKG